jgi:hypothetical protein
LIVNVPGPEMPPPLLALLPMMLLLVTVSVPAL